MKNWKKQVYNDFTPLGPDTKKKKKEKNKSKSVYVVVSPCRIWKWNKKLKNKIHRARTKKKIVLDFIVIILI